DEGRDRIRRDPSPDFEMQSRLQARLEPDHPISAEEFRVWSRVLDSPGIFTSRIAAEERASGALVGEGILHHEPWAFDPNQYYVGVSVDPAHRSRGLGLAMYHELERVAHDRAAAVLLATVREGDPRSGRFFERAGFDEQRRTRVSRLDLSVEPSGDVRRSAERWAADGLEFTTAAKEGSGRTEVRERILHLRNDAGKDSPRSGPSAAWTYRQFLDMTFESPTFLPDAMFLVRHRDAFVAMTTLQSLPKQPDTLHVTFSGTLRNHRGKGLATELKRRAVEFARQHGYRYLQTENDSRSAPIFKIDGRMGFVPIVILLHGEKAL
ncbi:MAG: GNAT family N-acetyltransferase, partial [Thermoplasmata archaeon]